mmetsp:Transcript_9770/g.32241  ORF Transcript_9770/g.32241 Transcript_9770/m.32241 type:complete len:221 (+) Transcript_9770:3154-3816(+)
MTSTTPSFAKTSGRGWWMLNKTVTFPCRCNSQSKSTTVDAFALSSPVVGSSRNRIAGEVRSSHAIETRLRSPPDKPRTHSSPMKVFFSFSIPSDFRTQRAATAGVSVPVLTRAVFPVCVVSVLSVPRTLSVAWNNRCSHTVDVPGSMSCWGTYPETRRISCGVTVSPFTRTTPVTIRFTPGLPAKISRSVDFPAPLGPKTANKPGAPERRDPAGNSPAGS